MPRSPPRSGARGEIIVSAALTGHTPSVGIVLSFHQFINSPKHTVKVEGLLVDARVFLIRPGSFQTLPSS